MNILSTSGRGFIAVVAVAASFAAGRASAAQDENNPYAALDDPALQAEWLAAGTIPAERPGLPQMQDQGTIGAQGPMRFDETHRTDPSIRDTDPLTQNGVWEQHFGNVVTPSNEGGEAETMTR
jgi:hypothetical protein